MVLTPTKLVALIVKDRIVVEKVNQLKGVLGVSPERFIPWYNQYRNGSMSTVDLFENMVDDWMNDNCDGLSDYQVAKKFEKCLCELDLNRAAGAVLNFANTLSKNDATATDSGNVPSEAAGGEPPEQEMDKIDFVENMKPLQVIVKVGKGFKEGSNIYPTSKTPGNRSMALVINNFNFVDSNKIRFGAKTDSFHLRELLSQLKFIYIEKPDVYSKRELQSHLKEFKEDLEKKGKVDAMMVIICSHGDRDSVEMTDGKSVNIWNDIVYQFDHERCPNLKGIPKIFIFQSCQGPQGVPRRTFEDSTSSGGGVDLADTIVVFPSLPLHVSNRDLHLGTWFIYCLTKVFMENAHELHFVELLEKLQRTILRVENGEEMKQICTWTPFLFKKFYFNPV